MYFFLFAETRSFMFAVTGLWDLRLLGLTLAYYFVMLYIVCLYHCMYVCYMFIKDQSINQSCPAARIM